MTNFVSPFEKWDRRRVTSDPHDTKFMVKRFADQTHQNFLFINFTDKVYQYI